MDKNLPKKTLKRHGDGLAIEKGSLSLSIHSFLSASVNIVFCIKKVHSIYHGKPSIDAWIVRNSRARGKYNNRGRSLPDSSSPGSVSYGTWIRSVRQIYNFGTDHLLIDLLFLRKKYDPRKINYRDLRAELDVKLLKVKTNKSGLMMSL